MNISYDAITQAFLQKITEFDFIRLPEENRQTTVDSYMVRAINKFYTVCKYDLMARDDDKRIFISDIPDTEADEIVDIISEGMIVQWMKPYLYNQEVLQRGLNTRDFTSYSPGELLFRIGDAYRKVAADYEQMIFEYSYNHNDLTVLYKA